MGNLDVVVVLVQQPVLQSSHIANELKQAVKAGSYAIM